MPKLNERINYYLNFFELPLDFKFDDSFEESIKEPGSRDNLSFASFSIGEQFRINLSIILSFMELNKLINNFNCNIVFWDEILDSGVDEDGMEIVLEKLKELTNKEKLCSYIISHRNIQTSEWVDNVIVVNKVNGFSKIS